MTDPHLLDVKAAMDESHKAMLEADWVNKQPAREFHKLKYDYYHKLYMAGVLYMPKF